LANFAARLSACFVWRRIALTLRSIPEIYFASLLTIPRPLSFSRSATCSACIEHNSYCFIGRPAAIDAARERGCPGFAFLDVAAGVVAAGLELDGF
jgi:hypothetical protein